MLRSIVFATDLGPFTPVLLQHVITLAEKNAADVHVLHVLDPVCVLTHNLYQGSRLPNYRQDARQMNRNVRQRIVTLLEDEYDEGHEALACVTDVQVRTGIPSDTILDFSHDLAADLIVMGSQSANQVSDVKLGSVAKNVLSRSAIPVYFVPVMKAARQTWRQSA